MESRIPVTVNRDGKENIVVVAYLRQHPSIFLEVVIKLTKNLKPRIKIRTSQI
jgi:hypothetical protein